MRINGSYRDPSGHLYIKNSILYRSVNYSYKENYEHLKSSGLYKRLVERSFLIPHIEVREPTKKVFKTLKPKVVDFISYPYEWSFSQLKAAALLTLEIQRLSLEHNMSLKDASAFNVQFVGYRPIFIDSLSFEIYKEGSPWVAYQQFCTHFLAPLALMKYRNLHLNKLSSVFLNGMPLSIASSLLPWHTWVRPSLLLHIHVHALLQKRTSTPVRGNGFRVKKSVQLAIIQNMIKTIKHLKLNDRDSVWSDYYSDNNYTSTAFGHKKRIVGSFLRKINAKSVLDLGANTGEFSDIANKAGAFVIATDNDPLVVEKMYRKSRLSKNTRLLPLYLDVTNPTPALGVQNSERTGFFERIRVDTTMALALTHHLGIANNIPFNLQAKVFSEISKNLIVEFIPKDDSQVQKLLSSREDIFESYNQNSFEREFSKYFSILEKVQIKESLRFIYLMSLK